jgi:hypothetical protein
MRPLQATSSRIAGLDTFTLRSSCTAASFVPFHHIFRPESCHLFAHL